MLPSIDVSSSSGRLTECSTSARPSSTAIWVAVPGRDVHAHQVPTDGTALPGLAPAALERGFVELARARRPRRARGRPPRWSAGRVAGARLRATATTRGAASAGLFGASSVARARRPLPAAGAAGATGVRRPSLAVRLPAGRRRGARAGCRRPGARGVRRPRAPTRRGRRWSGPGRPWGRCSPRRASRGRRPGSPSAAGRARRPRRRPVGAPCADRPAPPRRRRRCRRRRRRTAALTRALAVAPAA